MKDPIDQLPSAELLSREKEATLFRRLQAAPCGSARRRKWLDKVVAHYGRWVSVLVMAKSYGVLTEGEAMSIGLEVLVRAAERFDVSRGCWFSTFLRQRLSGAVKTEMIHRYQRAQIMQPVEEHVIENSSLDPAWVSEEVHEHPGEVIDRKACFSAVRKVLDTLSQREQDIVMLRSEGRTFAEIATRFSVSRQRVQQIWADVVAILRADEKVSEYRVLAEGADSGPGGSGALRGGARERLPGKLRPAPKARGRDKVCRRQVLRVRKADQHKPMLRGMGSRKKPL